MKMFRFLFRGVFFYVQNPDFLDIKVSPSTVRPYFEKIQTDVNRLEAQASSCNFYENRFKVLFFVFFFQIHTVINMILL